MENLRSFIDRDGWKTTVGFSAQPDRSKV